FSRDWSSDVCSSDLLTRRKEVFEPAEPGHVRIYACGVTPYAEAHIGHARPALLWSVIRKYLQWRGFRVTLVQNFTDVDDKIIQRDRKSTRLNSSHVK